MKSAIFYTSPTNPMLCGQRDRGFRRADQIAAAALVVELAGPGASAIESDVIGVGGRLSMESLSGTHLSFVVNVPAHLGDDLATTYTPRLESLRDSLRAMGHRVYSYRDHLVLVDVEDKFRIDEDMGLLQRCRR